MLWRVERAGSPGHYLPGWFVRGWERGRLVVDSRVDTWDEAMRCVALEQEAATAEACS